MYVICSRCHFRAPVNSSICRVCGDQNFKAVTYSQVEGSQGAQPEALLSDPLNARERFAMSMTQIAEPVSIASHGMRMAFRAQFDLLRMKLQNAFNKLAALATGNADFMPSAAQERSSGFAYAYPDTIDFRAAQTRRSFMKSMNSKSEFRSESTGGTMSFPLKIAASSQVLAAPNWAVSTEAPTTLEVMEIEARKRDIERLRQWFQYYGQDGLIKQRAK